MSLTPTLRYPANMTEGKEEEMLAMGVSTTEEVVEKIAELMGDLIAKNGLRNNMNFHAERLEVIATGETVEEFNALVVSHYKMKGVLHLAFASGEIIALSL